MERSLFRDTPPAHFICRIESFSTLSSSSFERYETREFVAGDCKWKLVLYPNGNASSNCEDHISLYLVLVDKSCLKLETAEFLVFFTLLVFDHVRGKYLSIQEVGQFDDTKKEIGFDKFLPLKIFKDPSNGYLMDDTCMFGADVFFNVKKPKQHCISMLTSKPAPFKHTWKVEKISELEKVCVYSEKFTTRGHDWNILLYSHGFYRAEIYLAVYLHLADPKTVLTRGKQVLVEVKFRMVDQVSNKHKESIKYKFCFNALNCSWGSTNFLSLKELKESTGMQDTCIFETEITVLGSAKDSD